MNSIADEKDEKNARVVSREAIKLMATQYQKYSHKQTLDRNNKAALCIQKCAKTTHESVSRLWNLLVPVWLRGPITPLEDLNSILESSLRSRLQNIPFSKLTLVESINQSKLTLVMTYRARTLKETILKLDNNQQFNLLIRKKAEIIPLRMSQWNPSSLSMKIAEILDSNQLMETSEEYVFVAWRGLFNEILLLSYFALSDENLCKKILKTIQNRQIYEQQIMSIALSQSVPDLQSSKQHLSQNSTQISRSSSTCA